MQDSEVDKRFIEGCKGDIKEAKRRYIKTLQWRENNNIDGIIDTPQPHFYSVTFIANEIVYFGILLTSHNIDERSIHSLHAQTGQRRAYCLLRTGWRIEEEYAGEIDHSQYQS